MLTCLRRDTPRSFFLLEAYFQQKHYFCIKAMNSSLLLEFQAGACQQMAFDTMESEGLSQCPFQLGFCLLWANTNTLFTSLLLCVLLCTVVLLYLFIFYLFYQCNLYFRDRSDLCLIWLNLFSIFLIVLICMHDRELQKPAIAWFPLFFYADHCVNLPLKQLLLGDTAPL